MTENLIQAAWIVLICTLKNSHQFSPIIRLLDNKLVHFILIECLLHNFSFDPELKTNYRWLTLIKNLSEFQGLWYTEVPVP